MYNFHVTVKIADKMPISNQTIAYLWNDVPLHILSSILFLSFLAAQNSIWIHMIVVVISRDRIFIIGVR